MARFCNMIAAFVIFASFLPSPIYGFGFEMSKHSISKPAKGRTGGGIWCYDKPECKEGAPGSEWETGFCKNDDRQSPIDIAPQTQLTNGPCPIDFGLTKPTAYEFTDYEIHNLGETLKIEFKEETEAFFRYPEKNGARYKLLQIHFHWGATDNEGSEHVSGGNPFSAEMHLVHYSAAFADAGSAMKSGSGDAFAVLGFWLEADPAVTDSFLKPLVDNVFDKVPNLEDKAHVNTPWSLSEVIREQRMAYSYEGSLTTPTCNPLVTWLMCSEPVKISPNDVAKMRTVSKNSQTFRSTQPLNGRRVRLIEIIH